MSSKSGKRREDHKEYYSKKKEEENFWNNYEKLNKPFYITDPRKIIPKDSVPAPSASNNKKKEENFWNNYEKLNKPFYTTDPRKIIPKDSVPAPSASNNNRHNYYQYTAPSFYKTPDGNIGRDNKPNSKKVEGMLKLIANS